MNKKNRIIVCLCLFVFMLSIPSLFTSYDQKSPINNTNLETATNYLFNSKNYTFNLDDFYDDAVMNKTFIGAKFQTEDFNGTDWSGTIDNDTVLPVNNTISKSPSNTGVTMIDGTFDDTDNMKANDDSYTEFTSGGGGSEYYYIEPDGDVSAQWYLGGAGTHHDALRDGIWYPNTPTTGSYIFAGDGDENALDQFTMDTETIAGTITSIKLYHYGSATPGEDPRNDIYIDGGWLGLLGCGFGSTAGWRSRTITGSWDQADINAIQVQYKADSNFGASDWCSIYASYMRLTYSITAELNFTIDLDFSELDTSDLLAVDVSSHHYTNVSTTIDANVYNYDTTSYVEMWSTAVTAEAHHYFMNDAIPEDFISGAGNLRLRFNGTHSANFEMDVDYIVVTFYYKLDLIHSKAFDTNGLFRYRWCIIGSLHYTQWVTFEVVDLDPNFFAISESYDTTRWILQNSTITAVEDFHDDINTDYWNLIADEETMHIYYPSTDSEWGDSYVENIDYPNTNFGGWEYMLFYDEYSRYSYPYIKRAIPYILTNYTSNSTLRAYCYASNEAFLPFSFDIYQTSYFDEMTITYNNRPAGFNYQNTQEVTADGYYNIDLGEPWNYYMLDLDSADIVDYMATSEAVWGSVKPSMYHHISKNYFGDGYMYMQTNETELISLKSKDYGAHKTLSSGDYFEIDFQTSSDSEISLILFKDAGVNKTLVLSGSGNTNFNRHTVQIPVSETVEFDQLRISSTFEDTDNVKVYDIKTYKYTRTGDFADFYVSPINQRDVYLTPETYNLRIFDPYDGDKKVDINITIGSTDYYYIYEPIEAIECRITLFTVGKTEYLHFEDYHVTINRSLNGEYNQFELVDTLFYADVGTTIYINVTDRFDNPVTIDDPNPISSSYIDLELEVYRLQIKNLMEQKTTVDINGSYTYPLLSDESLYFMLSEAYYEIGYYNPNNIYTQFLILLSSNQAYELNMSRDCHIYYTNQRMEPLNFYQFKTYINGTRIITNMFYATEGEHKGVEVKDLSDISVLNYTYIEGTGENNMFSLILTQYSLKVMSLQLLFNHVNITRDTDHYGANPYYWSTWLAPRETVEFKLFAGYYTVNITNFEDGGWSQSDYTLNGDDYILIGSNNTIYDVLVNIGNVNTSIGNQLTNIEINITNQNSQINNSVINIVINLDNINSTLGTMLLNIDTAISNINTSIINEIVSLGTVINNINTSISDQILDIGVNITNVNASIVSQLLTLGVDISNINGSIIAQIISLGVDLTNINTSISDQILSISVDISNLDTSITDQLVSIVADIENIETVIDDQTITILADITNINSSIISQLIDLGVDLTNINVSITEQILSLGVDISNLDTSITNQIVDIGVDIENINASIIEQILNVGVNITNINSSIIEQLLTLGVDITNINGSIINQILALGVDITNINTSLSNQILSLEVDITNINSLIIEQILLVIADIENIETVIDDQTLVILSDITNVNSTILNQMVSLGVDITNINASITNQILSLNVDLTNINATIYNQILSLNVDLTNINATITNLLFYLDVDITNIANNISSLYMFTNNSFINLDNVINTSFIWVETNIFSINQTISNLVIGVSNDIYLINGTISTMITSVGTNLLLMNVSIDTALFNLNTTIDLIGANITSNYILLNNSIDLTNVNINDSRIAMINNLLLVNNTMSTLIADVYSSVYLVNNSIYTAVVDLGVYLGLINNTINGNLSIVLQMNEFLTDMYQMTLFSELLNWTDIGLNTSLLTSQIDAWEFINHYKNQSVEIHLRYQDIIDNLTVSAQNTLEQYLPMSGTEYREWSVDLQEYIGEWIPLVTENKTVNFGFFEADIPTDVEPITNTFITYLIVIIFCFGLVFGALKLYYNGKERKTEVPAELVNLTVQPHRKKVKGVVDNRL